MNETAKAALLRLAEDAGRKAAHHLGNASALAFDADRALTRARAAQVEAADYRAAATEG